MSDKTIDQILNEIQGDDIPLYSGIEKNASAPTSSFSSNEIEEMAELLKSASVVEPSQEEGHDKIADILLLSTALDVIKEQPKFDQFRKEATARGHSEEEIDALIEKQAGLSFLKNLNAKQVAMGLGIGITGAAAGGAGGFHVGTEEQKGKTKQVGHAAFRAGRIYQHQRHRQRFDAFRERLRSAGTPITQTRAKQ